MWFIAIYTTFPNEDEANKVCKELLLNKIIACYNLFPIKSSYWWNSEIENSKEFVSILKTKKENWELVKKEIKKLHSYEVPCIIKFEVEANESYEKWIYSETKTD